MITTAPLPDWRHLLSLRFLGHPDGATLARPWLRPGDLGGFWLSRSAWSLAAIADAWARTYGRRPVVAVPDYICAASLGPLRKRADLAVFTVAADDLAPRASTLPPCDIAVLVHYFGHPAPGIEIRAQCDRMGALLVEDCAHVLRPGPGIGETGDLVLYSPHKLLAIPDGAVLVVRPGARALERRLGEAVSALGWAHPPSGGWRAKRSLQKTPLGALLTRLRPGGQPDFTTDPAAGDLTETPMPSPAAAALIARADLDTAARARIANAIALEQAVAPLADWVPLFVPAQSWVPYRLTMHCVTETVAAATYARLRRAALPVESWPDLPPQAGAEARRLRGTLLLLPCHQSLQANPLATAYAAALGKRA
jgi:hypothetical protein